MQSEIIQHREWELPAPPKRTLNEVPEALINANGSVCCPNKITFTTTCSQEYGPGKFVEGEQKHCTSCSKLFMPVRKC